MNTEYERTHLTITEFSTNDVIATSTIPLPHAPSDVYEGGRVITGHWDD